MRKHIYLLKKFLKILPLFFLISVPLCFALGRYMARPIVDISQASHEFAAGNLDARINSGSATRFDEIGDLAKDFNLMAQRLQNMINGQQKLLGDISHELRSPLARMQIALEILEKENETASQPMFEKIHLEILRLNELIGKILQINRLNSNRQSVEKADLNLLQLLQSICDDATFEGHEKNIKISLTCPKDIILSANHELIAQAVENVVRNAVKYSQNDGEIQVHAADNHAKNEVCIRITDKGPGIAKQHLPRIFEPFYRCQDDRDRKTGGVGLGLAIAFQAVQSHNGTISISNLEPAGLQVEIRLPKSDQSTSQIVPPETSRSSL
jgi:two-component system sensor histidine kinase CpxA